MTQVTETLAYRGDIGSELGREWGVGRGPLRFSVLSVLSVFLVRRLHGPRQGSCVWNDR